KRGYAGFTHPRALKILYAFIKTHYSGYIQGFVHALNKVMTHRIRTNFSQLLEYAGGLEGVGTKLRSFDQSFSPDAEDGKEFVRLKFVLDKDLTQQKSYTALIARKNEEGRALLDTGMNYLQGMHTSLTAISRETAFVNAASSLISGIEKTLSRSVHAFFIVLKLIRYTMAMEKGIF
ncbi:MAG: hypothetical protein FWG35_05180, partial [Spirochaetaceae bacterium]|nr:hypothetical protein [Spirochaetaceae bacterium]